jgi:hypothetical protein
MSNYRIMRVCLARSEVVLNHWLSDKFRENDYQTQLGILCSKNLVFPGSWSSSMRKLGNESTDVLMDVRPLQEAWCRENGVRVDFSKRLWMEQVLLAQIMTYQPDVLYVQGGAFQRVSKNLRERIRSKVSSVKLITGFWGDELMGEAHYKQAFSGVDVVFTASRTYSEKFSFAGIDACLLGWGFDTHSMTYEQICSKSTDEYDLVFLGSTGFGSDLHRGRYHDLVDIMENTSLQIWGYEPKLGKKPLQVEGRNVFQNLTTISFWVRELIHFLPAKQLTRLRNNSLINWKVAKILDAEIQRRKGHPPMGQFFPGRKSLSELFPDRCHGPLYSRDYYNVIGKSKLTLNRHRDELADGPNIRVFEATGMGTCLISDRGKQMSEFFVSGKEIVTFSSAQEAVEKIDYLLQHPNERRAIAKAGQDRTLKEHTIMNKCEQIDQVVRARI